MNQGLNRPVTKRKKTLLAETRVIRWRRTAERKKKLFGPDAHLSKTGRRKEEGGTGKGKEKRLDAIRSENRAKKSAV